MVKKASLFLLLCFLPGALLCAVEQDSIHTFTLNNDTGYALVHVFLAPGDAPYWGPDILPGEETIGSGESRSFFIHFPGTEGEYDILCVDADGYVYRYYDARFPADDPAAVTVGFHHLLQDGPELVTAELAVVNGTVPLFRLFIAPAESAFLGADLLDGHRLIYPDTAFTVPLLLPRGKLTYEIYAVDEDFDSYSVALPVNGELFRNGQSAAISVPVTLADRQFDGLR